MRQGRNHPQMTTIHVTQEDIENGERNRASRCPVAIAIKRATGNASVYVGTLDMSIGEFLDMSLPRKLVKFIGRFDSGKAVHPFTFTIDI